MITITLSRDQCRQIDDHWHRYLVHLIKTKYLDARTDDDIMMTKLAGSILDDIIDIYKKNLFSKKNEYKIKLSDHQAVIMYNLYMRVPLDPSQVFENNLRNHITSQLHLHLLQVV